MDPKCRLCNKEAESVGHLACACSGLVQNECRRHGCIGLRVCWELCEKYSMKCTDIWYKELADESIVSKDENIEVWWDGSIKIMQKTDSNRPYITAAVIIN